MANRTLVSNLEIGIEDILTLLKLRGIIKEKYFYKGNMRATYRNETSRKTPNFNFERNLCLFNKFNKIIKS